MVSYFVGEKRRLAPQGRTVAVTASFFPQTALGRIHRQLPTFSPPFITRRVANFSNLMDGEISVCRTVGFNQSLCAQSDLAWVLGSLPTFSPPSVLHRRQSAKMLPRQATDTIEVQIFPPNKKGHRYGVLFCWLKRVKRCLNEVKFSTFWHHCSPLRFYKKQLTLRVKKYIWMIMLWKFAHQLLCSV